MDIFDLQKLLWLVATKEIKSHNAVTGKQNIVTTTELREILKDIVTMTP